MFFVNFLKHILAFFFSLTDSYGLSIILLSLTVTVIMLPLFWIAEKIQNKERARKAKMQPALDKFKDVTNKQEKYYYTRRIYKQYNYAPFYSLTGLLGLFIQMPFFLAAYWMLLEYTPLQGVSFGPIKDLFQPDGLLSYGGLSINVLPFVMTIVNLFAGYLYAKNMNKSEQIQLIIIAFIFLILLYNLSAALVLYWTMNNVFAIGKNWLISRTNKPVKINNKIERYSLFGDGVKWLKSHSPQIIFVSFIWSIYFMGLSIFYKINLGLCLTSVMSILTSFFFLEIICSLMLIFKNKKKQLRWTMIIIYLLLNFSLSVVFLLVVFDKLYFISDSLILVLCSGVLLLFTIVLLVQNYSMLVGEPIDKVKNRNTQYYYFSSILIIISPLIPYYLNNPIYFSIASVFLYFIILLGIPLLLIAATNYLNKNKDSIYLLFGTFVALFFTLYTLPILTDLSSLIAENNYFVHIISLLTTTCIFIWLYHKSKIAILLFSLVLPLGAIVQIIAKPTEGINQTEKNDNQKTDLYNHLSSLEIKRSPNIYYLLYDTYINENLMKFYDIDNSEQMNYLRDKNFQVSENVYSIGKSTLPSIAPLLEVASVDFATQRRNIILGNSTVDNLLQKNGYETHYIVGEYFLRGLNVPFGGDFLNNETINSLSENGYSDNSMMTVLYSTLIGEFKFDNEFLLGTITEDMKAELLKRYTLTNLTSKPKFLFYHTNFPGHGVGNCHPNENELYAKNVQIANNMMKIDVQNILSIDTNAIIIIAGDHGAYRKGDCKTGFKRYKDDEIRAEHILDMHGSFLAVKYPDNYIQEDIILLQNVFINIFSYLFDVNNLYDYKIPAKTRRSNRLPQGCITNGKITFGADKGKSLEEIFSESSE